MSYPILRLNEHILVNTCAIPIKTIYYQSSLDLRIPFIESKSTITNGIQTQKLLQLFQFLNSNLDTFFCCGPSFGSCLLLVLIM